MGINSRCPHFEQPTFWPARFSGTRSAVWHEGHLNAIIGTIPQNGCLVLSATTSCSRSYVGKSSFAGAFSHSMLLWAQPRNGASDALGERVEEQREGAGGLGIVRAIMSRSGRDNEYRGFRSGACRGGAARWGKRRPLGGLGWRGLSRWGTRRSSAGTPPTSTRDPRTCGTC